MGCACCSHPSSEKTTLRVVIFGLENSGKTSLVQCLKTSKSIGQRSAYLSTHGVVALNAQLMSHTTIDLLLFDCGGCKHQRHMWPHMSNDPDLIVFVIDRIDAICLNDAKDALFDLLTDECLSEKPLLIVFTKSDQQVTSDTRQLEEQLDLSSIKDRPIHRMSFSSVTLEGWNPMLTWFAYFSHCKLQGKPMKILTESRSSRQRLLTSLNLSTASDQSIQRDYHHSKKKKKKKKKKRRT